MSFGRTHRPTAGASTRAMETPMPKLRVHNFSISLDGLVNTRCG